MDVPLQTAEATETVVVVMTATEKAAPDVTDEKAVADSILEGTLVRN
jgi:hypothetical protein